MTPCEYIRRVNDLVQGDDKNSQEIRRLLAHAENLAKNMSITLHKYEPQYWKKFPTNVIANVLDEKRNKKTYKYHKL
jgi:hypothetical protein